MVDNQVFEGRGDSKSTKLRKIHKAKRKIVEIGPRLKKVYNVEMRRMATKARTQRRNPRENKMKRRRTHHSWRD